MPEHTHHLQQVASQLLAVTQPRVASTMPSRDAVVHLINLAREILFPRHYGMFCSERSEATCLMEKLGSLEWHLAGLIHDATPHECGGTCAEGCLHFARAHRIAQTFVQQLPSLRETLELDVRAAYDGDPAAQNHDEILLAYPGFFAVTVYRLAHALHKLDVPLVPRMMTEYAHSVTGIDIHPGAQIGKHFFIDHGTGVVIGETTIIGDHVKLYQGVTLGALSFPTDERGALVRNIKRHPTIEDDVVIYAGATILGGDTVIGRGSEIGGNVWLIRSVPPYSKVLNRPQIEVRQESQAQ